jgi:ParB family chromosome partitioning protein
MARADRETRPHLPEEAARKRGMSVLRAPQQRVSQRAGMASEERALPGAMEIPIERVLADPEQPRRDWGHDNGERHLEELAASIREFGIIQPLLVREGTIRADGVQEFIVIAGGRRRAAAERAGLATVPVLIRGDEGVRVRVLQLLENLQRQQLSPMDEARAFQELIDIEGLTPPALAGRLKLSDQLIRDRLRLLTNQVVADALERRQLNMTAARSLQQLPEDQIEHFKERLQRGEEVRHAEIEAHRQRLIAAGVINPRFKGGGRGATRATPTDQTTFDPAPLPGTISGAAAEIEPGAATDDQTTFDPGRMVDAADDTIGHGGGEEGTRVITTAIARELGQRLWAYLPETLRASVRELAHVDSSLSWGQALAAGLAQHVLQPADPPDTPGPEHRA